MTCTSLCLGPGPVARARHGEDGRQPWGSPEIVPWDEEQGACAVLYYSTRQSRLPRGATARVLVNPPCTSRDAKLCMLRRRNGIMAGLAVSQAAPPRSELTREEVTFGW